MSINFSEWKRALLESAGDASPSVRKLGDHVLDLLRKDGCEATLTALLDYAQAGLCERYNIRAAERDRPSAPPSRD